MGDYQRRLREWLENNDLNWKILRLNRRVKTVREAAHALGIDESGIVKTVIIECDHVFYACVIRGDSSLDFSKVASILGCSPRLAKPSEVRDVTGYDVGGVPPVSLPRSVRVLVDVRVLELDKAFAGGGDEYTLLEFNPRELKEKVDSIIVDIAK
ncbi:MAG: hypothetical protein GSR79_04065 [Desulfurococcales archaeon]|nr:hypothetical protein [Desulfurococcales archaeon]